MKSTFCLLREFLKRKKVIKSENYYECWEIPVLIVRINIKNDISVDCFMNHVKKKTSWKNEKTWNLNKKNEFFLWNILNNFIHQKMCFFLVFLFICGKFFIIRILRTLHFTLIFFSLIILLFRKFWEEPSFTTQN